MNMQLGKTILCRPGPSSLSGAAARPTLKIIHWMIFQAFRPLR